MRRADRLFRIVEHLKARKHVVRASELADLLEVSPRTIYRDIADLITSGTPIRGEAGVGYQLDRQHVLRPLMFTVEEMESLILGTEMIKSWGDRQLSLSAQSALDKIRGVLPSKIAEEIGEMFLFALPSAQRPHITIDIPSLRNAIKRRLYVSFHYRNEHNEQSVRQVRPLCLALFAPVWLLLGWCETRRDFRNFRLDRITNLTNLEEGFLAEKGKRLCDYLNACEADHSPLRRNKKELSNQ